MSTKLGPDDLYRRCDPREIPFDSTDDAADTLESLGQDRAIDAARMAIGIEREGYNLFALGPDGIGKRTMLHQLLGREATREATPSDWCHVYNFDEPRRPRVLRLPPGSASRLRADVARAIAELRVALPAAFESEEHRSRKGELAEAFKHQQEAALEALQRRAKDHGVGVVRTEEGIGLAPLRGDEVIDPDAFGALPEREQVERKAALQRVTDELHALFRELHDGMRPHREALAALDRELAVRVAHRVLDGVRAGYRELPAVLAHLAAVERDVVDNVARFLAKPDDGVPQLLARALHGDDADDGKLRRYEVNVMIDHGDARGAPVIYEDHPTYANLIGRIEHMQELGALVTDFTLIRPGALHRANGGYLLLDAIKLLQQPYAWDALKRALRTRQIRIESLGQVLGVASTTTLEPEPIALDTKVVLLGDRLLYYLLATLDPEFGDLFKVMADFEEDVDRRAGADAAYARLVAGLVRQEGLRAFGRGAVARVIEHAARLASDAQRLSIRLRAIRELLREADYWAAQAHGGAVTAEDVQRAIDAQQRRAGRLRERMLDAIRRAAILIDTGGERVGQVNGLSVIELGGHAFGHPTRITARARVGKGDVVDIEREVELGGPIHSKGVLILAGLLGARYAPRVPLALSASIVFEQSYGGVEGDSASLAELCALLSAIAEVPLAQALAITGSVNQHGDVQPIGGVNEKIEGFFDVCRARGLSGAQGVVIPRGNVQHLMLRKDVIAAVVERRFHIHAAGTVDEALALLAGRAAVTVNALVEARLAGFAEDARKFLARA